MNRDELALAVKPEDMTGKYVKELVKNLFAAIVDELSAGGEVYIAGFGKFTVVERAARNGVNPKTGEKIVIAAHKSPRFKPAAQLKDAV